jgi:Domain of unknown function (DUF4349)
MRRVWLMAAGIALTAAACAQGGLSGGEGGGGQQSEHGAPGDTTTQGGGAAPVEGLPPLVPTVIKTADLEVQVERDGFGGAMEEATVVADRYGGFVVSSSIRGQNVRTGSLVIRVPAENFDPALGDLRGLGTVRQQSIRGEDVGQEFVDLEARLRNLRAQETVLLRLMDRAATISDTIRVQNVLQGVQLDVERIEGRLRYLEDRTSLSTIAVSLVEEGAVVPEPTSTFGKAWHEAVRGFMSVIAAFVVAAGYLAPIALLAAIGLLVVRRVLRSRPAPTGGTPA